MSVTLFLGMMVKVEVLRKMTEMRSGGSGPPGTLLRRFWFLLRFLLTDSVLQMCDLADC